MRIFEFRNDRLVDKGMEVPYLGEPYNPNIKVPMTPLVGELPWSRCCMSIGDWGIVSAFPRLMKEKYPDMKITTLYRDLQKDGKDGHGHKRYRKYVLIPLD